MKIKSVIDTGKKTKNDNPIIEVIIEDGRKLSCFNAKAKELKEGEELPVGHEIKEGNEYNGVKNWILNLPKEQKKGFVRDYGYEKKKTALEAAIRIIEVKTNQGITGDKINTDDILKVADYILNWINK